MPQINNDNEFKRAIKQLDAKTQRLIAAKFVEHVLPLNKDERVTRAIETAARATSSSDELSAALKSARSATIDSHARCGSEGNWQEQAGYFVSRAAVAALSPCEQCTSGAPAWQAAMSSRMAQTSTLIDDESNELPTHSESEWQYSALSEYLNA